MDLLLQNTAQGLKPVYDEDFEEKRKLKIGETYRARIIRPRNIKFHRKFFALIKIGCENSKTVEMPLEPYRKYALIKSGYANLYKTPKGIFVDAQSMAFDNMDEDKFQEVYNNVLDFVIKDTQASKEDIEKTLITFL